MAVSNRETGDGHEEPFSSCEKIQQTKSPIKSAGATNGGKLLTGLFLFCVGESRGRKLRCAKLHIAYQIF